jgi:hypothetical protein
MFLGDDSKQVAGHQSTISTNDHGHHRVRCYQLPDNAKPTIFFMATVKIASRNIVQPYSSARSLELTRRKPTILSSRGAGEQLLLAYSPGPGYYCAEICLTELVSFAKGMNLVIDSLLD